MNIGAIHPVLRPLVAALLCWSASIGPAAAEEADKPAPDKSAYSLFNPTPRAAMRELAPDRPDKTESAYTVDAGHLQLEMDFARFTLHQAAGVRDERWNVAPVNIKVGLLNNVDFQLIYDDYLHVRTENHPAHTTAIQSGFGDLTPRLKINLWGNDSGRTALAFLPFVKFPTNTGHVGNDAIEGGIIFPLAAKLPAGWDMGMDIGASFLRNANNRGAHTEFVNTLTFSHDIFGKLAGYVEFFSDASTERGARWVGTLDFGLTYRLTEDFELDAGVNIGLTPSADNVEPFTGLTVRY